MGEVTIMGIYMVYLSISHAVTRSNFFLLNVLNLLPVWISNCFKRSREHLITALEFKLLKGPGQFWKRLDIQAINDGQFHEGLGQHWKRLNIRAIIDGQLLKGLGQYWKRPNILTIFDGQFLE